MHLINSILFDSRGAFRFIISKSSSSSSVVARPTPLNLYMDIFVVHLHWSLSYLGLQKLNQLNMVRFLSVELCSEMWREIERTATSSTLRFTDAFTNNADNVPRPDNGTPFNTNIHHLFVYRWIVKLVINAFMPSIQRIGMPNSTNMYKNTKPSTNINYHIDCIDVAPFTRPI